MYSSSIRKYGALVYDMSEEHHLVIQKASLLGLPECSLSVMYALLPDPKALPCLSRLRSQARSFLHPAFEHQHILDN